MGRAGGGGSRGSYGRSSGGSSGRSGGGRSGGGRSGGGFSSSPRGGGSFGGAPRGGSGFGGPPGGGMNGPRRPPRSPLIGSYWGGRRRSGCLTVIVIILVIVAIFAGCISSFGSIGGGSTASNDITVSTVEREKLTGVSVVNNGYFTDDAHWISSASTLNNGLKYFYSETGVVPYLYITQDLGDLDIEAFANEVYDELIEDEAHMLLVFYEDPDSGIYTMQIIVGTAAGVVIDQEAADIVMDYIDYYYYTNYDEDEMFAKAFTDAADRIMQAEKNYTGIAIAAVVCLVIIVVLILFWRARKNQKNKEAEQTERILNTTLNTYEDSGDDEMDELKAKYGDTDNK